MDRREPALVAVGRVDLAVILHHRRERQGLAARAGAQVDHLLAAPRACEQRGELRTLVLHFDHALDERRLRVDRGAFRLCPQTDAQAERRPSGWLAAQFGERGGCGIAVGLEHIDPQVEGRARRERAEFRRSLLAEDASKLRVEPLGIIAGDPRRRVRKVGRCQPAPFRFGQRCRRKARAAAQRDDRIEVEPALEPKHPNEDRARRLLAHDPGGRRAAPQRVVHEAGDRRAIAGAGEAAREAPVLERIGGRPPARVDIGEHLDRGGKAGGGRHTREAFLGGPGRSVRTFLVATRAMGAPSLLLCLRCMTTVGVTVTTRVGPTARSGSRRPGRARARVAASVCAESFRSSSLECCPVE